MTPPPPPPVVPRLRYKRSKGPTPDLLPLPGAGEQRYHATRMALRWALYGTAPIADRTLEKTAERFGLRRASLEKAWREDGIEARQAEIMGIRPPSIVAGDAVGVMLGSRDGAEAEKLAREGQLPLLQARRTSLLSSLAELPSRIKKLEDSSQNCHPDSLAGLSKAIDSCNREASSLVTDLRNLNGMIAEATGLGIMQSLALAAAKSQANKPQVSAGVELGRVIELG